MSGHIITIDAGTTNTRAYLWDAAGRLVAARRQPVGVRNTAADGDNHRLRATVRACLEGLLGDAGLTYADIAEVAASGMITSNLGLVEVPHLVAPVSVDDLSRGLRSARIAEVCPLPIRFIPGVRNSGAPVTRANFEAMDMMRGEETETVALLERGEARAGWLIALPGSHSKFVAVDARGRIAGCLTSISGELIAAVTNDTILADAVQHRFATEADYDREMLRTGFDAAARVGLGRACFSARILSQLGGEDGSRLASYVLGACLQSDAAALGNSAALSGAGRAGILVAGRGVLCRAMADALRHAGLFAEIRTFEPGEAEPLSGRGALALLRRAKALARGGDDRDPRPANPETPSHWSER